MLMPGARQVQAQRNADGTWGRECVGTGVAEGVPTIRGAECLIANALNVILTIFALVGFVMFVYGAIMYMMSGGQPQKMEKAKDTITYVVVGLVLAISSVVFINLISTFTGVSSILSINWSVFGG